MYKIVKFPVDYKAPSSADDSNFYAFRSQSFVYRLIKLPNKNFTWIIEDRSSGYFDSAIKYYGDISDAIIAVLEDRTTEVMEFATYKEFIDWVLS